jgi:carboxypeptidase C (cathepsin A)
MRAPALRLAALLAAMACTAAARDQQRLTMQPISLVGSAAAAANGQGPERYSGYFKLNRTYDAHMFFFYFQARVEPDSEDTPVVLWMTGGPGCSSELAVFFENGPWNINPDDLSVSETKHGWDVHHHMIFVDQPVNTGFSYSDDDRDRCYDEECVSNDMLDFLQEFFKSVPKLQGRKFFVTGESFAGHYVPAVASHIFHATQSGEAQPPINLQGLAIGNGLTDPAIQYGAYSDYALQNKLIGPLMHSNLKLLYPACKFALELCDTLSWDFECILAVQFCQMTQFAPIMMENFQMNVYDIRKECEGALCYSEFEVLDRYLNQPSVRKALGVGDREWESCNMEVHSDFMGDWGHNYDVVLPELLSAGVRVMIYVGDQDFICNWVGNRQWVDVLPWDGSKRWAAAVEETWLVDGEEAGSVTAVDGFSFVKVAQAGHMVPMDQPKHGLDMITRFTRGEPLSTAGPSAASSYVRRPPADQSSARLLPGAMWQLRRAMPDRQASLTASGSEE